MKACILVLVALFACILNINCYKLRIDNFLIPERFQSKSNIKNDYLYPSNRQGSLYDEIDTSDSYKNTLAALEAAAAAADDNDSVDDQENYDNQDQDQDQLSSDDNINSDQNNYYDDVIKADPRDEETESHSSLGSGFQYVSGGAGEGKQNLKPDGHLANKEEVKSDEDLPAYCDPPNPCPVGYDGEDCDKRPYEEYTAEYSKNYQEQQNCMCDDDHNECHKSVRSKSNDKIADLLNNLQMSKLGEKYSAVVAKKSPRVKRGVRTSHGKKQNKTRSRNSLKNQAIKIDIVAKKSSNF
jgi:hypothetical protein